MTNNPKRIVITGGHGYVGSRLREMWRRDGHSVFLLSNKQKGVYHENERLIAGGTENPVFPKRIDALVHLYGLSGDATCGKFSDLAKAMNVDFTRKVKEWVLQEAIPHVIFASTLSIYDEGVVSEIPIYTVESEVRPQANYGRTKLEAENILQALAPSVGVTVLRKPAIYGLSPAMRYDTLIHYFIRQAYETSSIPLFNGGEVWRPTLSISHAEFAYTHALEHPHKEFRIINCVTENQKVLVYGQRIQRLAASHGKKVEIRSVKRPEAASYQVAPSLVFTKDSATEHAFIEECNPVWQQLTAKE